MKIEADGVQLEIDHFGGDIYDDVFYGDPDKPEHTTFLPLDKLSDEAQAEFKAMVTQAQGMLTKAKELLTAVK